MKDTYYITTPIYYVNDRPHIGHAYTTVACDVIARFVRLQNKQVYFLTGTDEHGQKIEKTAINKGKKPQELVDEVSLDFKHLMQEYNISNDHFIRTTDVGHVRCVQEVWRKLQEKGYIYLGKYSGWYAVRDECFYKENELVEGRAPTGAEVEWVEEESYFFKLASFQDKLLALYEEHPEFIAPKARLNEVKSFVSAGLDDLSISRTTFDWGIKVPGDEKHVVYVWLDALCNYLSAIQDKQEYWPCDLHIVGKDILRFHAVYWPAFLMALDLEMPKRILAHGWWTNEGEKISKSLGNVIDPLLLVQVFGLDYVRYFLLREVPFGNDGNFAESSLIARINADLVNNIGNLVQRVMSFIHKYCDAKIPLPGNAEPQDKELEESIMSTVETVRDMMREQALHKALEAIVVLATQANIYIDSNAPWQLRKVDVQRMDTTLYYLSNVIKAIGIMLYPFIPDSAAKILRIFKIEKYSQEACLKPLEGGEKIEQPTPVFPRLD